MATSLEFMALGQHYGLPTRLLDWSTNPLVAAWFACSSDESVDGVVNLLRVPPSVRVRDDDGSFDPFRYVASDPPLLVRVPATVARITAQQGLFSLHPDPTAAWVPAAAGYLHERLVIPADEKAYFLQMLHILGVNHARLMVDLEGHCSTLAWQYRTIT